MQSPVPMKANSIRIILPIFIIIGAIYCIRNGVVVSKLHELGKEPDSIILFHVVSLFTFGAKDFGAPIAGPWLLQKLMWLFFFLAPMITLIAMADLLSAVRPMFLNYILRYRPYYLVLGYGRVGKSALEAIDIKMGKKTYCIVLDRDVNESENGFSVIFEHSIFLKRNVSDTDAVRKFITPRCKGVFILTDQELLNLRLYYDIQDTLKKKNLQHIDGFTRIRSLELHRRLGVETDGNAEFDGNAWPANHFMNVHAVTPYLLFQSPKELDEYNKNTDDKVFKHYKVHFNRFQSWIANPHDCFIFLGFGSFSAFVFHKLWEHEVLKPDSRVVIIDRAAHQNWESYCLEHPEVEGLIPTLFDKDANQMVESNLSLNEKLGQNTLCIFATNDEEVNIKTASHFTRKYKNRTRMHVLLRTKYMDVASPGLLNTLIGNDQWVLVPTYTWIKLYFESELRSNIK